MSSGGAMPDMRDLSDADIVAQVLRGDYEAFGELVDRHQDVVYRHACGMGLDHDTSRDVVQDAFVKAYERLAECHDHARFRAWVCRIGRNLCLDHLRNVRRLSIPMSQLADADDLAAARTIPDDVDLTVRQALLRLSPPLREAFLLKHDAGYTYEEIAELTDVSPSAAKMRVHRARESLRDFLVEQGIHGAEVTNAAAPHV